MKKGAQKRFQALDGVRGIAALAVVLYHLTYRYFEEFPGEPITNAFLYGGQFGVGIFFILSGFVVLLSCQKKTGTEFIKGRFFRLFPTYWVAILVTVFVITLLGPEVLKVSIPEILINFTMMQKLFGVRDVDGVYWSLFVEWLFYFSIFTLLLIKRINALPVLMMLYFLAQIVVWRIGIDFPKDVITVVAYSNYFIAGCTCHIFRDRPVIGLIVALPLCLIFGVYYPSIPLIIPLAALLIFWVAWRTDTPLLANSAMVWLGAISYPLYLLHQKIGFTAMLHLTGWGLVPAVAAGLALVIVIMLAFLVHRFVEIPAMSMQSWLGKRTLSQEGQHER